MKIINNNNPYKNDRILTNTHTYGFNKLKKNENINTQTDIKRPAQAISFSGSKISSAIVNTKWINDLADFVSENEAAYNAIYSLLIAGILKPAIVVNMPGSEDKDKQIIATKNFLQAFLGSFLSLTIGGGLIKKSFDVVKNNMALIDFDEKGIMKAIPADSDKALEVAEKVLIKQHDTLKEKYPQAIEAFREQGGIKGVLDFIKTLYKKNKYTPTKNEISVKAKELIENLEKNHLKILSSNTDFVKSIKSDVTSSGIAKSEAFESFWKNSTGALTSIAKAKISSILLPVVVGILFADRIKKKQQQSSMLLNSSKFNNDKNTFDNYFKKNNKNINFKGNVHNTFAKAIEKGAVSDFGEKAVDVLGKFKKPSARMADLESFLITAYWINNTTHSKKIDPDQKLGLNVHTALVTAVSSTMAFLIDLSCDGIVKGAKEFYQNKLTEITEAIKQNPRKDITTIINDTAKNIPGKEELIKKLSKMDFADDKQIEKTISKLADGYFSKMNKLKSLTIFTLIVRFLVPVALVPVSGKLKKKITELTSRKNNTQDKK